MPSNVTAAMEMMKMQADIAAADKKAVDRSRKIRAIRDIASVAGFAVGLVGSAVIVTKHLVNSHQAETSVDC